MDTSAIHSRIGEVKGGGITPSLLPRGLGPGASAVILRSCDSLAWAPRLAGQECVVSTGPDTETSVALHSLA